MSWVVPEPEPVDEPSDLSLLGLMRHLANVERHWFRNRFATAGQPLLYADAFGETDPKRHRRFTSGCARGGQCAGPQRRAWAWATSMCITGAVGCRCAGCTAI
ncbi:MAG: DUF664 domain-containing protein [Nocardioidaceae bacterium]